MKWDFCQKSEGMRRICGIFGRVQHCSMSRIAHHGVLAYPLVYESCTLATQHITMRDELIKYGAAVSICVCDVTACCAIISTITDDL